MIANLPETAYQKELKPIIYQIELNLMRRNLAILPPLFQRLDATAMPESLRQKVDVLHIWALLLRKEKEKAKKILDSYPKEQEKSHSPFFLLQGCLLAQMHGYQTALNYFKQGTTFAFPPLSALLAHYLKGAITLDGPWMQSAFFFEKIELYKQLTFFSLCLGKKAKALYFERKLKKIIASHKL